MINNFRTVLRTGLKILMARWIVLIFIVVLIVVLAGWPPSSMAEGARSLREVCKQVNPSVLVVETKDQQPSTTEVLVAEDMRCRQCRGKCTAEDLRCRSQCSGEDSCLAHCNERSSKCEAMCKQIFQCQ